MTLRARIRLATRPSSSPQPTGVWERLPYSIGTRPIGQYTSAWEYLLPDALGSVRQIADANGNVTLAKSYEPYGSVLTSTGTASSIFGYSGEVADTTGLIYLRARYMQPTLGMFLSRDPWSGDDMRPGSMNGFGYVEGNPVNRTDPSGQIPGWPPEALDRLQALKPFILTSTSRHNTPLTNMDDRHREGLGDMRANNMWIRLIMAGTILTGLAFAGYRFIYPAYLKQQYGPELRDAIQQFEEVVGTVAGQTDPAVMAQVASSSYLDFLIQYRCRDCTQVQVATRTKVEVLEVLEYSPSFSLVKARVEWGWRWVSPNNGTIYSACHADAFTNIYPLVQEGNTWKVTSTEKPIEVEREPTGETPALRAKYCDSN